MRNKINLLKIEVIGEKVWTQLVSHTITVPKVFAPTDTTEFNAPLSQAARQKKNTSQITRLPHC